MVIVSCTYCTLFQEILYRPSGNRLFANFYRQENEGGLFFGTNVNKIKLLFAEIGDRINI